MKRVALAAIVAGLPAIAHAQSNPGFAVRQVLSSSTLNTVFSGKADVNNPHLTGILSAPASTIIGNPATPTCPAANCPGASNPATLAIKTTSNWYGVTTNTYNQAGWEASISEFDNSGALPAGDTTDTPAQNVSLYLGMVQSNLGGAGWTFNTDIVRGGCMGSPNSFGGSVGSGAACPGAVPASSSTIGYELDLNNRSEDDAAGGPFVVGMYMATLSSYASLAGLYYGNQAGTAISVPPSYHYGIFFSQDTVQDATVFDQSNATIGYECQLGTAAHSQACIDDASAGGGVGMEVTAAKTVADFYSNTTSPRGIQILGTHSVDDIETNSVSPASVNVAGTHSLASINTTNDTTPRALLAAAGQEVCLDSVSGGCMAYSTANGNIFTTNNANVIVDTLDNNGGLSSTGGAFSPINELAPATGATITLSETKPVTAIFGGSTLAVLTIVLPPTVPDGWKMTVTTQPAITALTLTSTPVIIGNLSTMSADTSFTLEWIAAQSAWLRIDRSA